MARPSDEPPGSGHRASRRLAALTLLALGVRVAFLLLEPATRRVGDELTWTEWARILTSPRVDFSPFRVHLIFYPPVYPYFLATLYALSGGFEAARWAQAVLGSLIVPAVGRAGTWAFSARVGLFGAAAAAIYPELVWFSVHFWSETVFMVLLWWAIERLLAADARADTRAAVVAGLLWGAAVLTRETVFYFIPLAALWLSRKAAPRADRRGAAFLLAALLVIAPWTWRNWVAFRAFVPVSTAGGQNLFQGNALIPRDETYVMVDAVQGRIEQYRYAMGMGLRAIRERQPWWIFEKLRDEMPRFWEADSLVLVHIKRGAYGAVAPSWAVAVAVLVLLPYLCVLALFCLGAVRLTRSRGAILLVGLLAYYNLLHVVTHGFARYRLPVLPVVFLIAGLGWSYWRERPSIPMTPRQRIAAAALALLLAVTLLPSFRLNVEHPAFGLSDTGDPPREQAPPP